MISPAFVIAYRVPELDMYFEKVSWFVPSSHVKTDALTREDELRHGQVLVRSRKEDVVDILEENEKL